MTRLTSSVTELYPRPNSPFSPLSSLNMRKHQELQPQKLPVALACASLPKAWVQLTLKAKETLIPLQQLPLVVHTSQALLLILTNQRMSQSQSSAFYTIMLPLLLKQTFQSQLYNKYICYSFPLSSGLHTH
jgi:hypothetical protein